MVLIRSFALAQPQKQRKGPRKLFEHQKMGPPYPSSPVRSKTPEAASQEMGSPEDII